MLMGNGNHVSCSSLTVGSMLMSKGTPVGQKAPGGWYLTALSSLTVVTALGPFIEDSYSSTLGLTQWAEEILQGDPV